MIKHVDDILAVVAEVARPSSEPEAIAYVFGHGETLIGYWFAEGHVLLKLQRACEPQAPGTVVTGKDVEIDRDVPAVWLMFEDAEAVRRMRDFLDTMARDLDASLATYQGQVDAALDAKRE